MVNIHSPLNKLNITEIYPTLIKFIATTLEEAKLLPSRTTQNLNNKL